MKPGAGKTFSAFGFTQLLMVVAIGFALFLAYDPWRWGQVREELLAKFPNVDRIEGAMLERWVAEVKGDPTKVGPQILDVRSEAEYRVSHIPGALHVSVAATPEEMHLLPTPEDRAADLRRPIVVCCTVGFDSGEVAGGLKRAGFSRVQMLHGGVFRWGNERRALVNGDGAAVSVVSVGSSPHSRLLDRSIRARVP